MRLYLSDTLAAQRRGRFLISLLEAEAVNLLILPEQGCLLMLGEDFTRHPVKVELLRWATQPGCILLLLPPYLSGLLCDDLDWRLQLLNDEPTPSSEHTLAASVAAEVCERILGEDGQADRSAGHCWLNGEAHTRYWRKHANSGIVAVTTLPLWSITLLEQGETVKAWIDWFIAHAGKSVAEHSMPHEETWELENGDYSLLICAFGYQTGILAELESRNSAQVVPLFNLATLGAHQRLEKLKHYGLIADTGPTDSGIERLKQSPYWLYAQELKRISA